MNTSETTANHAEAPERVRCAVYARVSVADASASELTSIDVQVEACQSFIASQQALGWVAIEPSYADHGYSGSNLNRPALQALLADMAKHKVDVVVVHRLDRLSRSIGDLCALVPFFEGPRIRLVSLVQSIDTATPSGRLTLNLLTSFSQYADPGIMQSRTAKADVLQALGRRGTTHYRVSKRDAISASGALNRPRRKPGGSIACTVSSFSDESTCR